MTNLNDAFGILPPDPLPADADKPPTPPDMTPWQCGNPRHLHTTQDAADRCDG